MEDGSYDDLKQLDIASIATNILEVPIPFSSLGIFHPVFHMSDNIVELPQKMLSNLIQLERYIEEYCQESSQPSWCESQLIDLHSQLEDFSLQTEEMLKNQNTKDGLKSQIEERDS